MISIGERTLVSCEGGEEEIKKWEDERGKGRGTYVGENEEVEEQEGERERGV